MRGQRQYDVIVIGGLGHVGLPLGLVLANEGFQVALYDVDERKRATVQAGKMPFLEEGAEPILQTVLGRSLHIAESLSDAERSEVVIITIGTPIDEYLNPNLRPLQELAGHLMPSLRERQCVLLRSTVCPGTTKWLEEYLKRCGRRVELAYCPERIVQGHAIEELRKLPQIVSGFSEEAVGCARRLFEEGLGVETITVTVQEAELAKLFSNAWRYIQFAIANHFYMMATEQGADYERIYRAMTDKYERAQDFPRPGFAAGPCLLKDTMQLAAFYGSWFQLGYAAMMVNEGLPDFLVKYLTQHLGFKLSGTRVGILGMAFKADSEFCIKHFSLWKKTLTKVS